MLKRHVYAILGGAALAGLAGVGSPAEAALALTAAGIADGFTLSTFATTNPGNTGCCAGPFGIAVTGGNVIVGTGSGERFAFIDVDGQTTATALNTLANNSSTAAYATAGGKAYGVQNGLFVQFNADGTVNHALTSVGVSPSLGLWGNPVTGKLVAASSSGLAEIDPLANGGLGSSRIINNTFSDGVSISPDGKIVYA